MIWLLIILSILALSALAYFEPIYAMLAGSVIASALYEKKLR